MARSVNVDFWKARWSEQRIGFHLPQVNPLLMTFASRWLGVETLEPPAALNGRRVLVPLCGKTVDLLWLAERGAQVVGVEFIEQAAAAFFQEASIAVSFRREDDVTVYRSTEPGLNLEIWVADFLKLSAHKLGGFDAVYDRAALIALDPRTRAAYSDCVAQLSHPGARLLLVTVEHDGGSGPPFSTSETDVRSIWDGKFEVELVSYEDLLGPDATYRDRAYQVYRERAWLGKRV